MKVIITAELGDLWATEEDFATLNETEIVELAREDLYQLVDGATWEVQRTPDEMERHERARKENT